jgi:hypothetical protein
VAADATRPGSALASFCAGFLPFAFAVPLADEPTGRLVGSEVPAGSETEGSGSGLDDEEDADGAGVGVGVDEGPKQMPRMHVWAG